MKKLIMLAICVMAIFTFVPRVNAQSDTANSKVFLGFSNSKTIRSTEQIYAGFGLKIDNFLQESSRGTNFVFNFGVKWQKSKIGVGIDAEISQYTVKTRMSLNGRELYFLKDLSGLKIGPTISFGKKFSLTTSIYCGYINGTIKDFEVKKRPVDLFCAGVSEKISLDFASCLYNNKFEEEMEFISFSIFIKGGVECFSDKMLIEPKGKLAYDAVITFGIEVGIFPDNKPFKSKAIKCPNLY